MNYEVTVAGGWKNVDEEEDCYYCYSGNVF